MSYYVNRTFCIRLFEVCFCIEISCVTMNLFLCYTCIYVVYASCYHAFLNLVTV